MEIVIQFGYVTLFASAYPLASLVALAANWVEIRSDCFKLARVCRRPRSVRADGIGVWKSLLSCVVWMSALTNCLIVGFTSDQMKEIFPAFYMQDKHGDTHLVHDKGWIAVFVIFGLERVLLLVGVLIYAVVPEVPEDVQEEVQRLHHVRQHEHEEVLRQVMRRRNYKKKN
jgi:anoctamin-10